MINFDIYALIIQMLLLRKQFLFQFEINFENKHGYFFAFGELNCSSSAQEKQIFFTNFDIQNNKYKSNVHFGKPCEKNSYMLRFLNKPLFNSEWETQVCLLF